LRDEVCGRCITRRPGAPPCDAIGVQCGIEQHLEQVIDICRAVDSPLIDPYLEALRERVCADCQFSTGPTCPCPLKYLLPLAVSAVEAVEQRRRVLASRLAWPYEQLPESD
jgi:hypothetical protein